MNTVKLNANDLKFLSITSNKSQFNHLKRNSASKVILNTCKTLEVLAMSEILRVEAYQNYTKVYMEGNQMLLSSDSLSFLSKTFGKGFYVCHKSHLVNLNKVSRYFKEGRVELNDGSMIPVARRRKTEFIEVLSNWVSP